MSYGEEVRMDKLSSQVRTLVGEWRNEFTLRGGNDYMGYVYQQCASALETLLPQIEALEQQLANRPYPRPHGGTALDFDSEIEFAERMERERLARKEQSK